MTIERRVTSDAIVEREVLWEHELADAVDRAKRDPRCTKVETEDLGRGRTLLVCHYSRE